MGGVMMEQVEVYRPKNHIRFVTASSLFDGHDASVNIMRRILQASGAEVIHLGHNRSAKEVVFAAIQEDAQAIAVSSYQGGHIEFFKYMVDLLEEYNASHIKIFGGGGGTILPKEAKELHAYGVDWIFSPEDGRKMGLQGMINRMLEMADFVSPFQLEEEVAGVINGESLAIARAITHIEEQEEDDAVKKQLLKVLREKGTNAIPVLGITGTGGQGKAR